MVSVRKSPSGAPIEVGAELLSAIWFVDGGAAAGGDGSVAAPFQTFAAGIAAAQADFTANARNQQLVVSPRDYAAEALQSITLDGAHGLVISSWASAMDTLVQPRLPQLTVVLGDLVTDGVAWTGVAVPQVEVTAGNLACVGTFLQSYVCNNLQAVDSEPVSGTVATLADFANCVVNDVTATTARVRNCPALGPLAVTGDLQIDMASNHSGVTATGTILVLGRCAQETQSVVVPAVAAGQVGYVDVAMTGQLAILQTGQPVFANPTADLVAAGAGGAYANCRCSAPGTVRMAFVGPLAGGAVDFTFASTGVA